MLSANQKQRGFNLIELMIIIAILATLAVAAVPLGGAWVQDADLIEVEGDLTSAIGRAKSSSLRNATAVTGGNPVSAICISDTNMVTILNANGAGTPDCVAGTGDQVWQAQLDSDVEIFETNLADLEDPVNDISCVCFNNKGLLTQAAPCQACSVTSTITLMAGRKDAHIEIY